ncbi:MAG: Hpt domain-containing protein [Longicatena sp.]
MKELLLKLKAYGADVDGAMERFLEDIELYQSCFNTYLEDEAFVKLGEALNKQEYDRAFEYAHTLKGITGNMGLTPLYQVICSMVEDLRIHKNDQLVLYYTEIMKQLELLKAISNA